MADNSRWKDIFLHLKSKGYEVYPPGNKDGECLKPYIVVKDAGTTKVTGISSSLALFDVMVYMPYNRYSELEEYVRKVEEDMDELFPMIRPAHFKTASFYDESVKGYMESIQYQNYQKNTRP